MGERQRRMRYESSLFSLKENILEIVQVGSWLHASHLFLHDE